MWVSCAFRLGLLLAVPPSTQGEDPRLLITAERLEGHVRALAADDLLGRETGSEGALAAARYLAGELRDRGLEPAGDDGGFLQRVPLHWIEYDGLPRLTLKTADGRVLEGVYGVDFDGFAGLPPPEELRVVHVSAREEMPSEPDPRAALFVDASWRDRRAWLEDSQGWGLVVSPGSKREGRSARTRPPRGRRWSGYDPPPHPALSIRGGLRERLLAGEIVSLRVTVEGRRVEPPAFNVVALLEGTGELGLEAVVFTAHYDHIGTREPPDAEAGAEAGAEGGEAAAADEDLIYNGADDDASGCAAVLELARALAAGPAPNRTLVFLLVTGEEIGLVGTEHYLEYPVVPLERTVCNLNFEMVGRPDAEAGGAGRLWLTGYERSNLGEAFGEAGLGVARDPRPDQNFFRRSDNYAFAVRGIVAQSLSSYDLHTDYHRVTDEADTLDYAHMEAGVRAAYAGARALADGTITPRWNPGGDPSRKD